MRGEKPVHRRLAPFLSASSLLPYRMAGWNMECSVRMMTLYRMFGGLLFVRCLGEEDLMVKPSIEEELSEVELKDTPSMLADLDSEVNIMVSSQALGRCHVTVT